MLGIYVGTTLVTIFSLIGMLVGFLLSGYYLRTALLTFKKKKNLPEWDNWKDLFINGLFATVIGLVYSLPILLIALFLGGYQLFLSKEIVSASMISLLGILSIFVLLVGYILPSGILLFVKKKDLTAAFKFKEVFNKAFTKQYFLAWLITIFYALILAIVFGFIPYVGESIGSFIAGITGITLLAEAFKKA